MREILFRAIPILAVLPLGGCPLFSADADIPEMCVTLHDRTVEGVLPGESYRRRILANPLEVFGPFFEVSSEITAAKVTLHAKSVPDLMFLDEVNVSMRGADPAFELPPLWLVRCPDYACASPTTVASAESATAMQATDYLAAGEIQLDITLTGPLPQADWKVDVEVCLSGTAGVELSL